MNWNKVMNIFIVIFIIINGVIFSISYLKHEKEYVLSQESKDQLREILYKNGIALYTQVPDYYPMKKIILHAPVNNKEEIAKKIFGEEIVTRTFTSSLERFTSDEQELQFLKEEQKGLVIYKGKNSQYIPKSRSKKDLEEVGEKFAKDITLSVPKLKLTLSKEMDENTILIYNEVYKGYLLFCNYVRIIVSEKGIEEATMLRYAPEKLTGNKQKLFSPDEALYNFALSIDPLENELYSIKNMDLGYDLGMYTLDNNVLAEAVPYYRIKLHNEKVYYINAYTNELKKENE